MSTSTMTSCGIELIWYVTCSDQVKLDDTRINGILIKELQMMKMKVCTSTWVQVDDSDDWHNLFPSIWTDACSFLISIMLNDGIDNLMIGSISLETVKASLINEICRTSKREAYYTIVARWMSLYVQGMCRSRCVVPLIFLNRSTR